MEDFRQLLNESWEARSPAGGVRFTGGDSSEQSAQWRVSPARRLRQGLHRQVMRDLEDQGAIDPKDRPAAVRRVREALDLMIANGRSPGLDLSERARVENEVVAEIVGLGPLEPLFADPTISDILVNGPSEVWVDRFGRLERTTVRFDDTEHLRHLLERLVSAQGRHLDDASPSVDARLEDGSRLHALLPPLAAEPVVSIRRMRPVPFQLTDLYDCGTMTTEMGQFLRSCVVDGRNIVISGGAASGKTTLLGVLARFIPHEERVVTIEETVELHLEHPHVVSLESRLANIEGRGQIGLRELVRGALRMRPDRIIVGEVRGPEVFDMLQAMNTGHDGSLTTVHANSPEDALRRLENLVLLGGFDLPSHSIRELMGSAFDLVVQAVRFLDGSRRITSINEVLWDGQTLSTKEIFRFVPGPHGADGRHVGVNQPSFAAPSQGAVGGDRGRRTDRGAAPTDDLPAVEPRVGNAWEVVG